VTIKRRRRKRSRKAVMGSIVRKLREMDKGKEVEFNLEESGLLADIGEKRIRGNPRRKLSKADREMLERLKKK